MARLLEFFLKFCIYRAFENVKWSQPQKGYHQPHKIKNLEQSNFFKPTMRLHTYLIFQIFERDRMEKERKRRSRSLLRIMTVDMWSRQLLQCAHAHALPSALVYSMLFILYLPFIFVTKFAYVCGFWTLIILDLTSLKRFFVFFLFCKKS